MHCTADVSMVTVALRWRLVCAQSSHEFGMQIDVAMRSFGRYKVRPQGVCRGAKAAVGWVPMSTTALSSS